MTGIYQRSYSQLMFFKLEVFQSRDSKLEPESFFLISAELSTPFLISFYAYKVLSLVLTRVAFVFSRVCVDSVPRYRHGQLATRCYTHTQLGMCRYSHGQLGTFGYAH